MDWHLKSLIGMASTVIVATIIFLIAFVWHSLKIDESRTEVYSDTLLTNEVLQEPLTLNLVDSRSYSDEIDLSCEVFPKPKIIEATETLQETADAVYNYLPKSRSIVIPAGVAYSYDDWSDSYQFCWMEVTYTYGGKETKTAKAVSILGSQVTYARFTNLFNSEIGCAKMVGAPILPSCKIS